MLKNVLKTSDAFHSTILTAKVRQLGAQEPSWVLLGSIWGSLGAPVSVVWYSMLWYSVVQYSTAE